MMKVSIIIPTIGRETLKTVLDSIFVTKSFSNKNTEIIVVGDGDFSRKKIIGNDAQFSSVKFFKTGKNLGSSAARNIGIQKATGEIVAFIGDDTEVDEIWLQELRKFHKENPQKNIAMLGQINWVDEFKDDPFYKWLNNRAQFSFGKIRLYGAKWSHFYTSNVSVKKKFLGKERFFTEFTGWGFEDSELGYRLHKKGMELVYYPECVVYHNHPQSLEKVCQNFHNARKNALIFEELHPEINIIPRGKKLQTLKILIKIAKIFSPLIPEAKWWYKWKEAWIREK